MLGLNAALERALHGLGLLGTVIAGAGCGSEPMARLGSFAPALIEAYPDSVHTSVFLLLDKDDGCSATLVAPNLLATARHCVSAHQTGPIACGRAALGAPSPVADLQAMNPDDLVAALSLGIEWYGASDTFVPTRSADVCGADFAFVLLTENVPSELATPSPLSLHRPAQRGQPYTAVGYGLDEFGDSGRRLSRTGLTVNCGPGACGLAMSEFTGAGGPCPGGSGGPALDAQGAVIGVLARGAADCSTAVYTSAGAFREFALDVAQRAAERGAYAPPAWSRDAAGEAPPSVDGGLQDGDAGGALDAADRASGDVSCSVGEGGTDVHSSFVRWPPLWIIWLFAWRRRRWRALSAAASR